MAIQQALKVTSTTEQMPGIGFGQSMKALASRLDFTAAPATGDVIQSSLIQAGGVIVDVVVIASALGAASSVEVGYGPNTSYFTTATSGVAGGVIRTNAVTAHPLKLTTNDTIDVRIIAAGATAAGSITIIVYFLPVNA